MSLFDDAIEYVLAREKGLEENNASDLGGITNFGISLRFLREISPENLRRYGIFEPLTDQTIRNITIDQAKFIMRGEFWDAAPFEKIKNRQICNYIFDMAVNVGIAEAIKITQRSLWAISFNRRLLKDDGVLGEVTLSRINLMTTDVLLPVLVASRAAFYRLLVEIRPKERENLDGWLNRCYRI